jgi:hypothetical protein
MNCASADSALAARGFDADLDHLDVTLEGRGTDWYPKLEY